MIIHINGPETNNIVHGGALSLDTNTDDILLRKPLEFSKTLKRPSKQVEKRSRTSSKRSSNQARGNNSLKRLFCETIKSRGHIWEQVSTFLQLQVKRYMYSSIENVPPLGLQRPQAYTILN